MNRKQKVLTVGALIVFAATLCYAPYNVSVAGTSHYQDYGPIWSAPYGQSELQIGVLFLWWFAVAILWLAAFFITRTPKKS